jgi:exonuclease V gamma subunit
LGPTLDNRLNWKKHIDETRAKATKILEILKILMAGTKWAANEGTLLRVHEMMILSALEYGGDPQQRTTYCIGSFLHLCRTENILRESGFEDLIE